MVLAENILCLLLLLIVAFQDIKSNQIFLIVLIALIPLAFLTRQANWQTALLTMSGFVGLTGLIALLLNSFLKKKTIAAGDFIMLAFISLKFNLITTLIILIVSSMAGIIFALISKRNNDIPFAGLMAIISMLFITLNIFEINITIDSFYAPVTNWTNPI